MKRFFNALLTRLATATKGEPVPCWTEYLREKGGFRG